MTILALWPLLLWGGSFVVLWPAAVLRYRSRREPRPGSNVFPWRRVVLGRNLTGLLIVLSYGFFIVVGPLLLTNTTTCYEAEFGF